MNTQKISIKSPATIANLVCGFDILGLALEEPYDIMTLENTEHPGLEIVHLDNHGLPTEPEQNVSGAALLAMYGEKVASGVKHADNITPCLLGGVTLIRSIHPLDIIPLSAPELFITVVHPQIEVRTADARQILKKEVPLKQAIKQWGNIAGLVAGLMQGDHALIGRSLEDVIIEPVRSILIPGFEETKRRSLEAGALGGGISE